MSYVASLECNTQHLSKVMEVMETHAGGNSNSNLLPLKVEYSNSNILQFSSKTYTILHKGRQKERIHAF